MPKNMQGNCAAYTHSILIDKLFSTIISIKYFISAWVPPYVGGMGGYTRALLIILGNALRFLWCCFFLSLPPPDLSRLLYCAGVCNMNLPFPLSFSLSLSFFVSLVRLLSTLKDIGGSQALPQDTCMSAHKHCKGEGEVWCEGEGTRWLHLVYDFRR